MLAFIKKAAALITVIVLMIATVVLASTTCTQGGYWYIGLIIWLPIFGVLCDLLGHPIKNDSSRDAGPFIID